MIKREKIKQPFGLNENNIIVHIANVEDGKEYICTDCKMLLIAVKGDKNQHHFRHKNDNECTGGLESSIHLAAKQVIMEKKQIRLPEFFCSAMGKDSRGKEHFERVTVVKDGTIVIFNSVEEEKELHEMRFDILAMVGAEPLIIEIYYRHKVEDVKIEKIKKANISAIEIDLSDLTQEDIKDWHNFWSCINDAQRIKWLHNAKAHTSIYLKIVKKIKAQEEHYKREEIMKLYRSRLRGRLSYRL